MAVAASVMATDGVYGALLQPVATALACTVPLRYTVPLALLTVIDVVVLLAVFVLTVLRPSPGAVPVTVMVHGALGQL